MDNKKVLVVDDESRMRKLISDLLIKNDFDVLEASDGEEALKVFYANEDKISLILLDVMMPKLDGYEVLSKIRESSEVPIVMLTAKGGENDVLKGFKNGAGDYIQKPFSPNILLARINAVLNRSGKENKIIECEGIKIDKEAHVVYIDDKPVDFSVKEFELLECLLKNENIVLTREKILSSVWNFDYFGDARTIDTHIKKVRQKLGKYGDYIKTIWGMGYKFSTNKND